VRKREREVLGEELLDVWASDFVGAGDLGYLEDLKSVRRDGPAAMQTGKWLTWTDRNRAR
jgi:hypothetical protein